jgi:hypothetical protein
MDRIEFEAYFKDLRENDLRKRVFYPYENEMLILLLQYKIKSHEKITLFIFSHSTFHIECM